MSTDQQEPVPQDLTPKVPDQTTDPFERQVSLEVESPKAPPVEETDVAEQTAAAAAPKTEAPADAKKFRRLRATMDAGEDDGKYPPFGVARYDHNPYAERDPKVKTPPIALPTATQKWLARNVDKIDLAMKNPDPESASWLEIMDDATRFTTTLDSGVTAMNRPGSTYTQVPTINNQRLTPGLFKTRSRSNQELNSREAMYYAMTALKVGIPATVPLWSSGWWVSFRPATEDEWVALEDMLTNDKSVGLRSINGLALSNTSTLTLETILNFVIGHIIETNIRFDGEKAPNYRKLLQAPDIDAFLCGFMAACYPNGYPITRKCSAKIKECFATLDERVLLARLLVVDTDRVPETHLAHMARNTTGQVTEKEIEEYVASLPSNQSFEYNILDTPETSIRIKMGVPSADDTINSGNRWNAMLGDLVTNIVNEKADERRRASLFERQARSTKLREYSHWIKEIHLDTNVVRGTEVIEKVLEIITANDEARQAMYSKIEEFIEHSRVAIVALPNYACPSCGGVQNTSLHGENIHPCIPLNVMSVFFHLAQLRVFEIMNRV
jgi:hypothetical protein